MIRGTVQVVLLNPEGYVLGVSRKDDHNDFGLIGGALEDYDNTIEDGAIRESIEETGLSVSNLKLIYAKSKGGRMGYTYIADYKGDINYDEPHVVKWTTFDELINGRFGTWNKEVYDTLIDLGYNVKIVK